MNKETDLSKASRMALPKEAFSKLVEGDLQACFSFLHYINNKPELKALLIESMYEDHVKHVSEKEAPVELMAANDVQ